jgi:hypothetical protein
MGKLCKRLLLLLQLLVLLNAVHAAPAEAAKGGMGMSKYPKKKCPAIAHGVMNVNISILPCNLFFFFFVQD